MATGQGTAQNMKPRSSHSPTNAPVPHLRGKVAGLDRLRAQDDVVAVVARQRAAHVAQLDHVNAAAGRGRVDATIK